MSTPNISGFAPRMYVTKKEMSTTEYIAADWMNVSSTFCPDMGGTAL